MIWATVHSWSCFCWLYRASPSLLAKSIISLISVLTIWWCPCIESSFVLLEEGVCYDSAVSWQNSTSLCPASFCTPRPNLPVTPDVSWLSTFAFQSPIMKRTSFLGVSSKRSGTWNIKSMNQGKLEVVKQEVARVNVDILGISELKWTGMGEFSSDDHYIYYCGQESLRRNGVAITVHKWVRNAVLGCNLKNDIEWSLFVSKANHSISQ